MGSLGNGHARHARPAFIAACALVAALGAGILASWASAATTPTITFISPPSAAVLGTTTAELAFETANDPTSVTCRLDSGAADACTSPVTYTTLSNGSHSVTVVARNTAGTATLARSFKIDTVPPTISITAPGVNATVKSPARLAFTTTDATAIVARSCKVDDGVSIPCVSGTTFTLVGGDRTIQVTATDSGGNVGSSSVSFDVATAPTLAIASPAANAVLGSPEAAITFETANDPTNVTCKLDTGSATACSSPINYEGLADGSHTVRVVAANVAGTTSVSRAFKVDTTAPTVSITAPVAGSSVKPPARLTFTTTDATPILTRTCEVDGGEPAPCVSNATFALPSGDHVIEVSATDTAGNVGSASVSFSVATLPTLSVSSPASAAVLGSSTAIVDFQTANAPTSVTCKLDTGTATACTSPLSYEELSEGSHSVTIAASNVAGKATVMRTFKVDTISPTVSISAPLVGSNIKSPVRVTFASTDSTPVLARSCRVDSDAAAPCVSGATFPLAGGNHTITVSVTDSAANVGSSSVSFFARSAPRVTIATPAADAFVGPGPLAISFSATESPTTTKCKLDSGVATACTSPKTYSGLAVGQHSITVSATNATGTGSATVSFTVQNLQGQIEIDSGPEDGSITNSPIAEFAFTLTGASSAECRMNEEDWVPCESPYVSGYLDDNVHTFTARPSNDENPAASASRTFTVDTSPPNLWWNSTPGQFDPSDLKVFEFEFSDSTAPVEIECALDNGAFAPCSSPYEVSGLPTGEHRLTLRATDPVGNRSQLVSGPVTSYDPAHMIEFSPTPPAVISPASTPISISSSVPVPRISCEVKLVYADGSQSSRTYYRCPESYAPAIWDPSAEVTITATAWNWAGAQIGESGVVVFDLDADAPQVAITDKPNPDEPFSSPSQEVNFTSDATDLDHFECSVNGAPAFECESPWTAENLPVCVSTLTVYAVDSVGNRGQDDESYWRHTAPSQVDTRIGCANPQMGGGWGEAGPSFTSFSTFVDYPSGPDLLTNALVEDAVDPLGATFVCKLDDRPWAWCFGARDRKNAISNPGPHTLQVATEFDGERDPTPASVSWVSTQPAAEPGASFQQTPPREGADSTPSARFSSDTPGATFECRLDSRAWLECASPIDITTDSGEPLATGSHTFEVRAQTPGATQSEPISTTFVVTESLPTPIITSGPENGDDVNAPISYAFFAPSTSSTFVCSIDGGEYTPCESPITLPESNLERRTFSVRSVAPGGAFGPAAHRYVHQEGDPVPAAEGSAFITKGPAESTTLVDGRVQFAFDSNDAQASFVCKMDEAEFAPCESPVDYELGDGAHQFEVGVAGAAATTSRSFAVAVDYPDYGGVRIESGPETGGTPPNSMAEFGAPEFTFYSTIDGADLECRIDGGAWTPCESPYRVPLGEISAAVGAHIFAVRIARTGGEEDRGTEMSFNPANYADAQIPISIYPVGNADGLPEWKSLSDGIVVNSSSIQVAAYEYANPYYGSQGPSGYALKCTVDDRPWELCGSIFTSEGLTNGTHRIGIRSPDAPGHRGYTEYRDFVVEDPDSPNPSLPTPVVTAGPDGEAIATDIAEFIFTVPTGYSAECRVDDDAFSACESPFSTPPLLEGDHEFHVRAVSASGEVGVETSRGFSSPDSELAGDYGEVVDREDGNEQVTDEALEQIKQQVIDGLNAPNEASGAASAFSGASASNFAATEASVDKETIANFLRSAGAWPTAEQFMGAIGAIGREEPVQVRINLQATYEDDPDPEESTQHMAVATQDFNGGPGANYAEQINGVNYRKLMISWNRLTSDPATGEDLSEPRMYTYGYDLGFTAEYCDMASWSCQGGTGYSWKRWMSKPAGFVCNPVNEFGILNGSSVWHSGFEESYATTGTVETVLDDGISRCQDPSAPYVLVPTARIYQWMSLPEAYDAFARGLRFENCTSTGGVCRQVTVSLDDIDRERAARLCVLPQFQAICQVYGNKVKLDGLGKSELSKGDPVNPATGNFELTKTDLAATGKGGELTLARTYNSTDKRTGALGRGWSWAGTEGLARLNNGDARVAQVDGKTFDFTLQSDGSFDAPYGHDETLVRNEDGTYSLTAPYGEEVTKYDQFGRVIYKADKSGNQVVYQRDGTRLDALIGSGGQRIDFEYSSGGMLESATDSNGREVSFEYDDSLLTGVKNPEEATVNYEYDSRKYLTVTYQPDGTLGLVNTYDRRGRVLTQVVGEDPQATFEYGTRTTKYTDPAGRVELIRSDRYGRPTSQTSALSGRTVFHRDARGRISSLVRADGKRTTFEYDSQGRLIEEIDPAGNTSQTEYDAASNVESTTDALGRETTYTYGENNDLETSTDPMGFTTEYEWSEPGVMESSTDPLGRTTEYENDSKGRVERVTDPLGGVSSVTYDASGYLASATDALGRETNYENSAMGNLKSTTDPAGATTTNEYDELGNLVKTTDPLGIETTTAFSAPGRPVQTNVDGQVTSRAGYDALGRAAWTSDGRGATTNYAYGTDGNLARTVSPERSTSSYRYDSLGRRTAEIDARGNITRYAYDVVGNVTKVTDASGAETSYTYDAVGNLTSEVNALGQVTTYEYDDNDRLEREVKPLGLITEFTYDAAGQLTSKSVAGETTSYFRDALGRTTRILLADGSEQRFEYNLAGELKKAISANVQTVDFTYDAAGRIE
ncbi:MAG: hypothetical protein HYX29_09125, partial [Solirubrobacterales bacterium]|nr:hypothetical protein [Solirubrobacterales bacterium]